MILPDGALLLFKLINIPQPSPANTDNPGFPGRNEPFSLLPVIDSPAKRHLLKQKGPAIGKTFSLNYSGYPLTEQTGITRLHLRIYCARKPRR
jgi:hypothetical protein